MTDRSAAQRVLAALQRTPVGDGAVLVGSSGLFGFDTRVEGYATSLGQAETGLSQLLLLLDGLHA